MGKSQDSSRSFFPIRQTLRMQGDLGLTRLDAPEYLRLSLPQRISELRAKGYRIDSEHERVGDIRVARYRLVEDDQTPELE